MVHDARLPLSQAVNHFIGMKHKGLAHGVGILLHILTRQEVGSIRFLGQQPIPLQIAIRHLSGTHIECHRHARRLHHHLITRLPVSYIHPARRQDNRITLLGRHFCRRIFHDPDDGRRIKSHLTVQHGLSCGKFDSTCSFLKRLCLHRGSRHKGCHPHTFSFHNPNLN